MWMNWAARSLLPDIKQNKTKVKRRKDAEGDNKGLRLRPSGAFSSIDKAFSEKLWGNDKN